MRLSSRTTVGTARRVLAVFAVIGQLLGTVGIIPVRADSNEDSSTPFPCQNHPCGCRTAARCWAGACCCYTMQQKVAWAAERGITPPDHAVLMAAKEAAQERTGLAGRCCSKKERFTAENPENIEKDSILRDEKNVFTKQSSMPVHHGQRDQQSIPRESKNESKVPDPHHGVGWVAGLFAQQCHGQGFDGPGLLNIGVPPTPSTTWIFEIDFINTCDSPNQIPIPMPVTPLVPPPKF